ncbi:hypothetical protein ALP33_02490 [Pseudomonas amygdali pv. lachrymans]|uniref:Transposase n=1 Tax=Pseudomonas amygdali pv. lachrymans TaxID=53707 RepID=A0AB37R684_PSEAV|nr:hypothetical protein ALP33_02490 [Pseudomonas amygdali pv. lachrymans]
MEYHPQTALADEAKEAELIWIERNPGLLALDDQGRPFSIRKTQALKPKLPSSNFHRSPRPLATHQTGKPIYP